MPTWRRGCYRQSEWRRIISELIEQLREENERLNRDCCNLRYAMRTLQNTCEKQRVNLLMAQFDAAAAKEDADQAQSMATRSDMRYAAAETRASARVNLIQEQAQAVHDARLMGQDEMRQAVVSWLEQQELDALIPRIRALEVPRGDA